MKELISGIVSNRKRVGRGQEREKKSNLSRIPFLPEAGKKIKKKIAKKFKKLKNLFPALLFAKTG